MGLDVYPNSDPNCIDTHIDSVTEREEIEQEASDCAHPARYEFPRSRSCEVV